MTTAPLPPLEPAIRKTLLQKAARYQDIEEVRYAANLTDHMSER
jgi:hypothetical protein